MTELRKRFKKFGGDFIPDIIEYLKKFIEGDEYVTISVGCDSIQRRRKTIYALTIMLYNNDIRNGSHVIFYRENVSKIRNHYERLQKESEFALEVAEFLNNELSAFYTRKDLSDRERKKYKFHVGKCQGDYSHVTYHNEDSFISNMSLSESEKSENFKLVDIHVDYNPQEGYIDKKGVSKNKSNASYKAMVPWIRSMGYRVFAKNIAFAATSAADLLLQD